MGTGDDAGAHSFCVVSKLRNRSEPINVQLVDRSLSNGKIAISYCACLCLGRSLSGA